MKSKLLGSLLSSFCLAAFTIAVMPPDGICEGTLAASSEASVTAGFPVFTGPGATVLTPTGAYVVESGVQMNPTYKAAPYTPPAYHKVVGEVKNYSWGPRRTLAKSKSHQRIAVYSSGRLQAW